MNIEKEQMLESVRRYLSRFGEIGKYEEKILNAMDKIDRREFVDGEKKVYAYIDSVLPTEKGQTISQPSTVARMLQLLELHEGDSVLEIGAGSGWNCALMSYLVGNKGKVLAVEVIDSLAESARERIEKLGIENIMIENKDFRKLENKFNKIIFTAGILPEQENIIEDYAFEHLNDKGILVCPLRVGHLIIVKKKDNRIIKDYTKEEYIFVPLIL